MAKIALLIGVSEYETGLSPLPASEKDVEVMQRVLLNHEIGDFDEVQTLLNPDSMAMQEAIELLFLDRHRDDLVLLYFSGHGIKNESGRLNFATTKTRKSSTGELIQSTAVPSSFIHEMMNNSRSRQQVVMIDSTFSGAFADGLSSKSNSAVLTSSTSTQYSFAEDGSELSIYTRYLIEGMETGAADLNNDGIISVDELHEYAKQKVQETAPAMTPQIYAAREGYKILIAKLPTKERTVVNTTEVVTPKDSSINTADQIPIIEPNLNETEELIKFYQIGKLRGAGNDVVAENDHLGFNHYFKAFADLIESPYTKPPLTIGIFGSWGMGKSFLLDHITRELKERDEKRRKTKESQTNPPIPCVHVVKFNAWEYSAAKLIWSGLVRKIMNELEKKVSWGFPGLFAKKFSRNFQRELEDIKGQLIFILAILAGLLVFTVFKFKIDFKLIWGAVLAVGVTGLFKLVADTLSKPMSQWIATLLKGTDYGKKMDYMEEIHSDLELLAKQLQKDNGRVLIIIDDLDRCEPQKAVEVLQAVNLLLNFKSFIVCLGIDARIITRAVEKHYSNLLGPAGASGYEYLDKIVQIPFRIPEPNPDEIKSFISEQLGNPKPPVSTTPSSKTSSQTENTPIYQLRDTSNSTPSKLVDKLTPAETPESKIVEPSEPPSLVAFSYDELEAFYHFIRFLRPNPRHLKRLVNVYRLVRTLAEYKGEQFILNNPVPTIRWLVISGQWPYTTYAMLYYFGEMLERIEEGKIQSLPENDDPLEYLLSKVNEQFQKNKDALIKQRKLDHDTDLLRMLLQRREGRLTWDQLTVIRQYTVNFNPAVEATLKAEVPVNLLIN
ncbi:MAG: caspase family protein [Komarekiella atlantica HA4396-MV6]|jgi:Cdc6-like AAA superfamily ATPase|nr:caspase family protein [Komarekiella atlantica HA4396-MV6]